MIKKIEKIIPVGIPAKTELSGVGAAILLAFIRSLFYFNSFIGYYNSLFDYYNGKRTLVTSRRMTDFYVVIEDCFNGFWIVIFLLFALCIYHYAYHYRESKSIYTMKRLPKRSELHKRCLTVPLISIVVCIILPTILLIIYFKHYMTTTPPECLVEGQWEMLITNQFL